jgi:hypothetical protein
MSALSDAADTDLPLDIETGDRRRAIRRRILQSDFIRRLMPGTIRRAHEARLITQRGALQTGCQSYQLVMTQRNDIGDFTSTGQPVDAELLIAPGCGHCPGVYDALGKLSKEGLIGRLAVINIAIHPEAAEAVGTRSVPWVRIGPFELEGAHSLGELKEWAERAASGSGMGAYLAYLLEHHQLPKASRLVLDDPGLLHDLVPLLADLETPMAVRIGVGAVFEEVQDHGLLDSIADELGALTRALEPQVRADACHYLGLTGAKTAVDYVRPLLDDEDAEVREIAAETLPLLEGD